MLAKKIRNMLAEQLAISESEVTDKLHLIYELHMDELDACEFAIFLEEEFGGAFSDSLDFAQLEQIATFENLVKWVEAKDPEAVERYVKSLEKLNPIRDLKINADSSGENPV